MRDWNSLTTCINILSNYSSATATLFLICNWVLQVGFIKLNQVKMTLFFCARCSEPGVKLSPDTQVVFKPITYSFSSKAMQWLFQNYLSHHTFKLLSWQHIYATEFKNIFYQFHIPPTSHHAATLRLRSGGWTIGFAVTYLGHLSSDNGRKK